MATEIDPLITKCIKLLPIKTLQAAAEMKKLIFEAITERTKNNSTVKEEPITVVAIESTSSTESEGKSSKRHYDETPKETEKATKRPKLMTQVSKSSSSSSKDSGATIFGSDNESTDIETEEEAPPKLEVKPNVAALAAAAAAANMDEYADDIGLTCIVCRLITEEKDNKLIQCQECQQKYHQNCHKPPLSKEQLSDPRLIWYCNKCTKNMKKIQSAKPVKGKPSPAVSVNQTTAPAKESPLIKAEAIKKESPGIFTFKRTEQLKSNDVAKEKEAAAQSKSMNGLARLAATIGTAKAVPPKAAPPGAPEKLLSGFQKLASSLASKPVVNDTPTKASPKPAVASSSTTGLQNPVVAANNAAEKRMQMMKKKAAAKLQPKMP